MDNNHVNIIILLLSKISVYVFYILKYLKYLINKNLIQNLLVLFLVFNGKT